MEAGVDDQSLCPEELHLKLPEQSRRVVGIPSLFRCKPLRVEAPAFPNRGVVPEDTLPEKFRQRGILGLKRPLKMVSRHRLVVRRRAQAKLRQRHPCDRV